MHSDLHFSTAGYQAEQLNKKSWDIPKCWTDLKLLGNIEYHITKQQKWIWPNDFPLHENMMNNEMKQWEDDQSFMLQTVS